MATVFEQVVGDADKAAKITQLAFSIFGSGVHGEILLGLWISDLQGQITALQEKIAELVITVSSQQVEIDALTPGNSGKKK